jgi:hypothetical protein
MPGAWRSEAVSGGVRSLLAEGIACHFLHGDDLETLKAGMGMEEETVEHRLRWDDPELYPKEAARVRRYRRLQSRYREHKLDADYGYTDPRAATKTRNAIPSRPVGSLLAPVPHPSRDDRNFLAPSAYAPEILEYVNDRLPRVRDADGTLEEVSPASGMGPLERDERQEHGTTPAPVMGPPRRQ